MDTLERGRDNASHEAPIWREAEARWAPPVEAPTAWPPPGWADPPRRERAPRWGRNLMLAALTLSALTIAIVTAGPLSMVTRAFGSAAKPSPTATLDATRGMPAAVVVQTSTIDDTADWYLSNMSLDEKLGQMIMVETYSQNYGGDIASMVNDYHAGALIIYKKNMVSPQQLSAMVSGVQAHANLPLFVTMDEEGGNVDRLGDMGFAAPLPSARSLGATGDPQKALAAGQRAAAALKSLGINVDLAPVADVRSIPNPVIGPRIYGGDPGTVDAFAGAFLDGLQQNGVIGTLKHWPGIGSIALDPHKTLPEDTRSRAQLDATDFAAFRGLLDKQPGMIMVTHVLLGAIDPSIPSSLSPKVVQGVLRDQLGYQGVVITDNLWMKGVSLRYSLGEASVLAVLAGDDLLEGPWNPSSMRQVVGALRDAVQRGRISQDRIDQSVRRILTLKAKYGILPLHQSSADGGGQSQTATGAQWTLAPADMRRVRLGARWAA